MGYEPARPHSAVRSRGARATAASQPAPNSHIAIEVALFFKDLRRAFRMSPQQVAQRLATRVDIVAALEAGQIANLPPWPETCRIVRTYTGLVGLDPRPILHSMEILFATAPRPPVSKRGRLLPQLGQRGKPLLAAIGNGPRAAVQAAARGMQRVSEVRHASQGRRPYGLFAVMAATVILLITQTSVLEAAVSQLPPSVARIVRGAHDYVVVKFAPVRDGLRWIDVPDPRTRKGDKLQTTAQSD
jgi:hypothetical protein